MSSGVKMTKQRTLGIAYGEQKSVDALSDEVAHWLAAGDLPAQLVTGHPLIDTEHRFLISAIANLRRICLDQVALKSCIACGKPMQERCEGNLIGLLGDIFSFILDHFKNEESIMRDSMLVIVDREVCQAHMEDHAEIAAKVQEIVSALDSQHVVSRIRELDALLSRWVTNHVVMHDLLLSRWVSRDDSLLRRI
jgi:hemerythrin-like metal-binding protein